MRLKMVKKIGNREEHVTSHARFELGGEAVEVEDKEGRRLIRDFPGAFKADKEPEGTEKNGAVSTDDTKLG